MYISLWIASVFVQIDIFNIQLNLWYKHTHTKYKKEQKKHKTNLHTHRQTQKKLFQDLIHTHTHTHCRRIGKDNHRQTHDTNIEQFSYIKKRKKERYILHLRVCLCRQFSVSFFVLSHYLIFSPKLASYHVGNVVIQVRHLWSYGTKKLQCPIHVFFVVFLLFNKHIL